MKRLFLFLMLSPVLMHGQKLFVQVLDEDLKAIPYCSVTWNSNLGLVTDSSGRVLIPDISKVDSIIIQCMGYHQKILSRKEIIPANDLVVRLKPAIIELPGIIVWKAQSFKEFGVTVKKEGYIYFKNSVCTNFQLAVKITGYKSLAKLQDVSVYISSASQGTIPFRIRFYEINNAGLPGKDLINENIIVADYRKGKWNNIDLSEYNLGRLPEAGFFVSVERLCNDLNENSGLCIAGTDEINSEITYFKKGNSEWRIYNSISKRKKPTNFLIKANLGFPAK